MRTKPSIHDNCECVIDTTHLNAHGMPAVKCREHGAWISWISREDQRKLLKLTAHIDVIQEDQYEKEKRI
jgi:hypothetical protein